MRRKNLPTSCGQPHSDRSSTSLAIGSETRCAAHAWHAFQNHLSDFTIVVHFCCFYDVVWTRDAYKNIWLWCEHLQIHVDLSIFSSTSQMALCRGVHLPQWQWSRIPPPLYFPKAHSCGMGACRKFNRGRGGQTKLSTLLFQTSPPLTPLKRGSGGITPGKNVSFSTFRNRWLLLIVSIGKKWHAGQPSI